MHGSDNIGIGFHALRGSGISSTGSNNIEIVAGLLDNQRLMASSGNLSNRLNIQNTIAGNTSSRKISIGHATLSPDAPLSVRKNDSAVAGHGDNTFIQTWWCNGVKVAHVDCDGNFVGAGVGNGVQNIEGIAEELISAPSSPTSPTSGVMSIRGTGVSGWTVQSYVQLVNRDPGLTIPNGAYVCATLINGTYRPTWVSCGS
jgi:hypothetical protein